jgi:mannosyltransferase
VLTLVGFALRFYRLGEWSFWIDEALTNIRAQAHYDLLSYFQHLTPLSIILQAQAFQIYGITEWSARLVPALIGVASIPLLYFPARRYFGTTTALIAALLLVVSPWHLFWSQNARFYVPLLLFYNLALFALLKTLEENRSRYLVLFVVFAFLAFGERPLAIVIVPVAAAYLILLRVLPFPKPPGFNRKNILLLALPFALGLSVDLVTFIVQGRSLLLDHLSIFLGNAIDDPIRIVLLVCFSIGVPLVALAFFSGVILVLAKNRIGLLLFVSAVLPVLILAAINPFVFTVDRYVFVTLPAWIILAAHACSELFRKLAHDQKLLAVGIVFMLVGDTMGANLLYYHANHGNRLNWRDGFARVQREKHPHDRVVTTWPELAAYYADYDVIAFSDVQIDDILGSNSRWWFVYDSESVWLFNPHLLKEWIEENAILVDMQYLRVRETINLKVLLYDPVIHAHLRDS